MSPILGILASQGKVASTSYDSIATQTVGAGGASSVTFSSIPGTYKHLQIRGIGRTTFNNGSDGAGLVVQFNGDTATNYSDHYLYGTGATAAAGGAANDSTPQPFLVSAAGQTASSFGVTVLDVLEYANPNIYKTVRGLSGVDNNGTGGSIYLGSINWRSTSAITSILLKPGAGNFVQYSSFALYGIK